MLPPDDGEGVSGGEGEAVQCKNDSTNLRVFLSANVYFSLPSMFFHALQVRVIVALLFLCPMHVLLFFFCVCFCVFVMYHTVSPTLLLSLSPVSCRRFPMR